MQQPTPSLNKSVKYDGLDLMKAMAIYFVLIYHFPIMELDFMESESLGAYSNYFVFSIFSTCVPIFFFVNGALLLNKSDFSLKVHVSKILKTIILVIAWGFITMISLSLILGESISAAGIVNDIYTLKIGWVDHLWFLETLVVIYIFFPLLFLAFKTKKNYFYFFFACVMILTFGNTFLSVLLNVGSAASGKFLNTNLTLNYFSGFHAFSGIYGYSIGYFMLGGMVFSIKDTFLTHRNRMLAMTAIPLSMTLLFLYGVLLSFRYGDIWDIGFEAFDSVFALLMTASFFILMLNYQMSGASGKVIRHISENTLGIYLLHRIVGALIKPLFIDFSFFTTFLGGMVFAAIVLILCLLLILILKKVPYFNYLFSMNLKPN